jgi:acetolactate synthase-1/2/3 large subunit
MSEMMTGAEMVVRALQDQGVEHLFGYPGGAVLPIYDALFKQDGQAHPRPPRTRRATHAAEGYARSTGQGRLSCSSPRAPARPTPSPASPTRCSTRSRSSCITGQVPTR